MLKIDDIVRGLQHSQRDLRYGLFNRDLIFKEIDHLATFFFQFSFILNTCRRICICSSELFKLTRNSPLRCPHANVYRGKPADKFNLV